VLFRSQAIDTTAPAVGNTSSNVSSAKANEQICINASASDATYALAAVWAMVHYPNGTDSNVTLNDTGCNAGVAGDNRYGGAIDAGSTAGTLTINTTFANDSFGNKGNQTPYPQINVTISAGVIVDTSVSGSVLTFGPFDPGTAAGAAFENPIVLTNTANSNVAVDVYLNNTNMTSGGNTIAYGNLSVLTYDNSANAKNFTGIPYINGTSANNGYQENLGVGSSVNLYFWQGVPGGQAQGVYTDTVRIHSVADGQAP
jgi:hypothetical protein